MKIVLVERKFTIPEGVKVRVSARRVTAMGPRGVLKRQFKQRVYIRVLNEDDKKIVVVGKWLGKKKEVATTQSILGHIKNMCMGVSRGFCYKMKAVYAHFPITCTILDDGKTFVIGNFVGMKLKRRIEMRGDTVIEPTAQKDEFQVHGNSLEDVSQSAASIQNCLQVPNKDIRKFLDGIYVSEKGFADDLVVEEN